MTSSPGSMKAIKALSMPSFAPVVMVTSVFGLTSRPRNGEYAFAIAFFNRGRPLIYPQHLIVQSPSWEPYLRWGVLIAFDLIQSFFRGISDIFGRVVTTDQDQILVCPWLVGISGFHAHKKPCPILIIGCTGEFVAASFTMVLRSL